MTQTCIRRTKEVRGPRLSIVRVSYPGIRRCKTLRETTLSPCRPLVYLIVLSPVLIPFKVDMIVVPVALDPKARVR